jgi:hypothetical protein
VKYTHTSPRDIQITQSRRRPTSHGRNRKRRIGETTADRFPARGGGGGTSTLPPSPSSCHPPPKSPKLPIYPLPQCLPSEPTPPRTSSLPTPTYPLTPKDLCSPQCSRCPRQHCLLARNCHAAVRAGAKVPDSRAGILSTTRDLCFSSTRAPYPQFRRPHDDPSPGDNVGVGGGG